MRTALPPANSTSSPRIIWPSRSSGLVERTTPSTRSGSGVVNTSSVGRLGWCSIPYEVVNVPECHALVGSRPTVRSVPGASRWSASNLRASSAACACSSSAMPRVPRRHRIVGIQPAHVHDLLPQLRERRVGIEIGVHLRRPALGGTRHDRPVGERLGQVSDPLHRRGRAVTGEPVGVEAGQHARLGRAGEARWPPRVSRRARAHAAAPSRGRSRAPRPCRARSGRA